MATLMAFCLFIVLVLLLPPAFCTPLRHEDGSQQHGVPLGGVSGLAGRRAAERGGAGGAGDARLPLPGPQEIEAIKKVAQILVMLGEQVIPAIISEPAASRGGLAKVAAVGGQTTPQPRACSCSDDDLIDTS